MKWNCGMSLRDFPGPILPFSLRIGARSLPWLREFVSQQKSQIANEFAGLGSGWEAEDSNPNFEIASSCRWYVSPFLHFRVKRTISSMVHLGSAGKNEQGPTATLAFLAILGNLESVSY